MQCRVKLAQSHAPTHYHSRAPKGMHDRAQHPKRCTSEMPSSGTPARSGLLAWQGHRWHPVGLTATGVANEPRRASSHKQARARAHELTSRRCSSGDPTLNFAPKSSAAFSRSRNSFRSGDRPFSAADKAGKRRNLVGDDGPSEGSTLSKRATSRRYCSLATAVSSASKRRSEISLMASLRSRAALCSRARCCASWSAKDPQHTHTRGKTHAQRFCEYAFIAYF